jgi:hypothetical protein
MKEEGGPAADEHEDAVASWPLALRNGSAELALVEQQLSDGLMGKTENQRRRQ